MAFMTHDKNALGQYGREGYRTHLGYAMPSDNMTTAERQRLPRGSLYAIADSTGQFWFKTEADRYAFEQVMSGNIA